MPHSTNVVQSLMVQFVLKRMIFPQLSKLLYPLLPAVMQRHATLWSENGDALSELYAGPAALKSGLTRSGSVTWRNMLADVQKSVTRMVQGVVRDEEKQETIDQLLGKRLHQRD